MPRANKRSAEQILRPLSGRLDKALESLELDDHRWSDRPCRTCREISDILGRPFGCSRYADLQRALLVMARTGDPTQMRAALNGASPE